MTDADPDPEDAEADDRASRRGFNPMLALGVIVLIALAAYVLFAAIG